MSTAMVDAALELAASGWAVFPCRETNDARMKAPYLLHGFKEASTHPERIRAWWSRWPAAMIGAPVPASVLVLDIDPRNGGSLAELEGMLGQLPETLTAWSGRGDGGRHLYYRRPAGALCAARLPAGIDLKVSGYCIVPPSVHPVTDQPYRWEGCEMASLPYLARSALRRVRRNGNPVRPTSSGDGSHLVAFLGRFPTQGINGALYWAAGIAAKDGLLEKIREDLIATAVSLALHLSIDQRWNSGSTHNIHLMQNDDLNVILKRGQEPGDDDVQFFIPSEVEQSLVLVSLNVDNDHDEIHYSKPNSIDSEEAISQAIEALVAASDALRRVRKA